MRWAAPRSHTGANLANRCWQSGPCRAGPLPQAARRPTVPAAERRASGQSGLGRRIERIDALRGLALMGIVQVNIQSFTWGAGEPLGYLSQPPSAIESALYFLQAAFLEGKFYPIFAFLFGLSMTLQHRKLRRRCGGDAAAATAVYRRRLLFLLFFGLVHGFLLYCGDVLSAYAICGLIFAAIAPARLRALAALTSWCLAAAAVSIFVPPVLVAALDSAGAADQIPQGIVRAHLVYCHAGFIGQLPQRAMDELWQQIASVVTFWPQVIALLALGALAGRLGWLQHPGRHLALWRRAWWLGLAVGLPSAALGAAMSMLRARNLPGAEGTWDEVALGASSLLAAAYVAGAVYVFDRPWARQVCGWLASAGRLSLTNYVGQSVLMGALLSGWGLGLGASASRAQLAALALLIFLAQIALSRWVLAHYRQGPLEALWRRWTYRNVPRAGY